MGYKVFFYLAWGKVHSSKIPRCWDGTLYLVYDSYGTLGFLTGIIGWLIIDFVLL